MKLNTSVICCLLAGMLVGANGFAEEYDFEVGLAFDSTHTEGSKTITTPGETIVNSSDIDTDVLSVFGSWYFTGLSDDKGPRARAALVDRASSLSFGYSRTDQTRSAFLMSDDPSSRFPPFDSTFESDGDAYTIDFRYVHRDSGWFGDAALLSSDTTRNGSVSDSVDATVWNLGIGKYLFDTTTLGLDVGRRYYDGNLWETDVVVSFSHLGNLGERWQYGIDLAYGRSEGDFDFEQDTWAAAIALYPTRDFEFGVGVEDISSSDYLRDSTGIEGFASWFITPSVRVSARYRVDDIDYWFGNIIIGGAQEVRDAEQDSYEISATIRF